MSEFISAAEANRYFSKVIRDVREEGQTYVVTSHGTPVAKIIPVVDENDNVMRERAKQLLLERLGKQPVMNLPRFSRDELYDD